MRLNIPYWYLLAVPVLLFALGAASNQLCLVANHGTFPVQANKIMIAEKCIDPEDAKDLPAKYQGVPCQTDGKGGQYLDKRGHVIMSKDTHLNLLGDIFGLGDGIYSIGDFMIGLGQVGLSYTPIAWLALVLRRLMVN